jgi:choline dehydrogenase-like flavoprotein
VHRHEVVASRYYGPKLEAIMRTAGAEWTLYATSPPLDGDRAGSGSASHSRHIMGTCRMGTDPRTSVFDPWQRLHDVENVVCTDSSVFPTSTGYGPTLTIVALAIRACRDLAGLAPLTSARTA